MLFNPLGELLFGQVPDLYQLFYKVWCVVQGHFRYVHARTANQSSPLGYKTIRFYPRMPPYVAIYANTPVLVCSAPV